MLELVNLLVDEATSNASIGDAVEKIKGVVQMVLNVIYIALGLFLVVKGALLGMQIVKAADEPQVRQEKIGSLKWLVIGVAIAYGVTFIAQIVTNYFESIFGTKI